MVCTEKLIKGYADAQGNHSTRVEQNIKGHYIDVYRYHSTDICKANRNTQTFFIDNGGWDTLSTNRAISDYRKWYYDNGYCEVFKCFTKMVEQIVDECKCGNKMYRCYYGDIDNSVQPYEVTVETRKIGNDKFCTVTVASTRENELEYPIHTYEFYYKGVKTMTKALINKISVLFPF